MPSTKKITFLIFLMLTLFFINPQVLAATNTSNSFFQKILCIFTYHKKPECYPAVNPISNVNNNTFTFITPQSLKGEKGDTGMSGIQGLTGPVGPRGPQGVPGPKGDDGKDGDDGDDGADGIDGVNGLNGADGADGADGIDGVNGLNGADGADGTNYTAGSGITIADDQISVSSVSSSQITDGTITNDDVSNSAGISWSKLSKSGALLSDLDAPAYTENGGKYLRLNAEATGLEWASGASISANSLNFSEMSNSLTLDANTTLSTGAYTFKILGSGYVMGDTIVDCDGSATDEVSDCEAHNENDALVAVEAEDHLCADSLASPTAVRIDMDSDCTNNSANDGTYIIGTSATAADTAVTSEWAFSDTSNDGSYDSGEDLYIDNLPQGYYSSGTLHVGNISLINPVYDDLRISGSQLGSGASAPDQITWINASTLRVKGFDGTSTSEQLFFEVQLPHNYKEGTEIHPHIHWGPSTAAAGNVKWFLDYAWVNINGTFSAVQTISTVDASDQVVYKHQLVELSEISGTNKQISSMLVGRIYRTPADPQDTYEADAGFLELDFHYEIDGLGSKYELVK